MNGRPRASQYCRNCGPDSCGCYGDCAECDERGEYQPDGRYLCPGCLVAEEAARDAADLADEEATADTLPAPAAPDLDAGDLGELRLARLSADLALVADLRAIGCSAEDALAAVGRRAS